MWLKRKVEADGQVRRGICKCMKVKGEQIRLQGRIASARRDPHTPVFFVKADSKGLARRIGVKTDSKRVTALTCEACSR